MSILFPAVKLNTYNVNAHLQCCPFAMQTTLEATSTHVSVVRLANQS